MRARIEAFERRVQQLRAEPPPYYRQRPLGAAEAIAVTRRAQLVGDQVAHVPFGTHRLTSVQSPVRVGITGTGADLLLLAWSAADLRRERTAGVRLLSQLGVRPATRVANALPGALTTPGALLLGDVVEALGALDVPLGAIDGDAAAQQAWNLFDRVQPQVLILTPAAAVPLFAHAPAAERRWWTAIIWLRTGAAPFAVPPLPPGAGFQGAQRIWLAVPEAACFAAHTCDRGAYHVDPDIFAEVIAGELALTPLAGDHAVLRYGSELRARALAACSCDGRGAAFMLDDR